MRGFVKRAARARRRGGARCPPRARWTHLLNRRGLGEAGAVKDLGPRLALWLVVVVGIGEKGKGVCVTATGG